MAKAGSEKAYIPRLPAWKVLRIRGDIPLSLMAYERACIDRAMVEADGNVHAAAKLLGISKSGMYRKLAACRGLERVEAKRVKL